LVNVAAGFKLVEELRFGRAHDGAPGGNISEPVSGLSGNCTGRREACRA
jgi:hypothetical protein